MIAPWWVWWHAPSSKVIRLILMHFRLGQAADIACQERLGLGLGLGARARDNCVMIVQHALMCLNVCKQCTLHVNTNKLLHNTIK